MASKQSAAPSAGNSARSQETGPTYEEIARRSYELYLARGGESSTPAQQIEDWLKAEAQLRATKTRPS